MTKRGLGSNDWQSSKPTNFPLGRGVAMRTMSTCPFCYSPTKWDESGERAYTCGTFIKKQQPEMRYVRRCNH